MNGETPPAGQLLILDDDPAVGITIGAIAETVNFEARSATRAEDFFRILDEWIPTHIVLDLVMPDVDGIEAMRRLGEMRCRAAIIITSGMGSRVLDAARRAAVERGLSIAGVLFKPFTPAALRALLTKGPAAKEIARETHHAERARPSQDEPREIAEKELAAWLDSRELRVFYQPKIECATGALAGFEALVRWNRPGGGTIAPDLFVPLAERADLIDRLTDQVLDRGLEWLAASFLDSAVLLSLNLSARSLGDMELANRIAAACREHAIDPARIVLEITETSAMTDPLATLDILTRFRIKGFHLSIDDFGVGYSSLPRLARLPFSELKIDKMFVISAQESQESRNIVQAIIGLAHSLGIRVSAEGVEDEWTLGFLKTAGCDLAQGYFIGGPMDGEAVPDWVRTWKAGVAGGRFNRLEGARVAR